MSELVHGSSSSPLWVRLAAFLSTKAPNTRYTYEGVLKEWMLFLKTAPGSAQAAKAMVSANDLHALAYRAWLTEQPGEKPRIQGQSVQAREVIIHRGSAKGKKTGLEALQSNATIAKKLAVLRRIYRYLISVGLYSGLNPFDSERVPPPPKDSGRKRPTEMVSFDKVKELVASPDDGSARGVRDRAMLAALFGGGLRRSEIVQLRLSDVRKTKTGVTYLYLRATKAKRDAMQAIPPWAAKDIWRLLNMRREMKAAEGDYLFTSFTGKGGKIPSRSPVSTKGVYAVFKAACRHCGLSGTFSPHSARATAITKLLDQGLSHRDVREFSRHASVAMVELYDKRRISVDDNPAKDLDFDE